MALHAHLDVRFLMLPMTEAHHNLDESEYWYGKSNTE